MADIIKEVIDQEKDERIQRIVRGAMILILVGGIVAIIFSVVLSWQEKKDISQAEQDGDKLQAAIRKIDMDKPKQMDKIVASLNRISEANSSAYSMFSRLYVGVIEYMRGNSTRSIIEYKNIAANRDYDPALRRFIGLSAISGELRSNVKKPDEAIAELQKINSPDEPLYGSTSLLLAVLLAESGREEEAATVLDKVAANKDIGVEQINNIAGKLRLYFLSKKAERTGKSAKTVKIEKVKIEKPEKMAKIKDRKKTAAPEKNSSNSGKDANSGGTAPSEANGNK